MASGFAVPAAIVELLAQEVMGQCVVGFREIRTEAEDSAVDARLGFAMEVRPVVEPLEHEPLVDAADHFSSLLAGGVETEVLQRGETIEGDKVPVRAAAPMPRGKLTGEKLGSPAFSCDSRPRDRRQRGGLA
jgi:hypothetical protein